MSRFVSEQTIKIDLENGDWVEIQEKISWQQMQEIFVLGEAGNITATALPMLKKVLRKWSFTDDEEKEMPCTEENIELLDFQTVQELVEKVMAQYTPAKK